MSRPLNEAWDEIAERIARAPHLFLIVDLEGTLVPLADRPDQQHLPEPARELLRSLSACEGTTVAVISGRERVELAGIVNVPGLIYVGDNGLEISGPDIAFAEPSAAQFGAELQQLRSDLESRVAEIPGVAVECKGYRLLLHYYDVPEDRREELRRVVHSTLANAAHPFLLREGRMVYEIRPRGYWNKGTAIGWLREHLPHPAALPIYLGDDNTDEDAFLALPDGITIKVGEPSGTAAAYYVDGPPDVSEFLKWGLARLRDGPST